MAFPTHQKGIHFNVQSNFGVQSKTKPITHPTILLSPSQKRVRTFPFHISCQLDFTFPFSIAPFSTYRLFLFHSFPQNFLGITWATKPKNNKFFKWPISFHFLRKKLDGRSSQSIIIGIQKKIGARGKNWRGWWKILPRNGQITLHYFPSLSCVFHHLDLGHFEKIKILYK